MTRKKTRTKWTPILLGGFAGLFVAAGVLVADRETGIGALYRTADEVRDARGEVRELQLERARLRARIARLNEDPAAIEAVAREYLGMVRPGELVVRWPVASAGSPD